MKKFQVACVTTLVAGVALGVASVWLPPSDLTIKLALTDGVLLAASVAGAIICKLTTPASEG